MHSAHRISVAWSCASCRDVSCPELGAILCGSWAEDLNRDEPSRCVEQRTREHDVTNHPVVALGHKRNAVSCLHHHAKVIDQGSYDNAMLAKRLAMHRGDGLRIIGSLLPDVHHELR